MGSRRGRKRKTEEERDEFWSQRPDWLPEGWTMNVNVRKDGATAGIRDRYYYEPRTSHRFRSRKEVEKFIQIGEVPRYKPKPKTKKSNVVHRNSKPTPSSDMVLPPTLEFYSKHLSSFMSGGRINQQSEVGATIIGQTGSASDTTDNGNNNPSLASHVTEDDDTRAPLIHLFDASVDYTKPNEGTGENSSVSLVVELILKKH
ncbi:hypothetical protein AAC387_Pa03g2426 [Persea americana]